MTQEQQQAMAELPIWAFVVIAVVAGFSGEMWRADKAGLRGWALFYRVVLRAGASVVFGLAAGLLAWAAGAPLLVAAALMCVVATLGADVASALFERWLAKRAGVCDVPPGKTDGQ
ncbi:Bacteriophage holin Hol, superfamily III [compost metagenome]